MKYALLAVAALSVLSALPARADDVRVPAAMQRCMATEDCTMVSSSCTSSCATLPVNKAQVAAIQAIYAKQCGKAADANGACASDQALTPACINNRCTIGYLPYSAGDYKPGAFPVPESPVPMQGGDDYNSVNDRDGNFSAYSLPSEIVKQNMIGQYNFPAQ